jgi:SNF2 family DNA or RNA helicase
VRFGQTKPVKVMRLFIKSSMEDRLREIQMQKQKATDSLLNEDSTKGIDLRSLSASNVKLLRLLFRPGGAIRAPVAAPVLQIQNYH